MEGVSSVVLLLLLRSGTRNCALHQAVRIVELSSLFVYLHDITLQKITRVCLEQEQNYTMTRLHTLRHYLKS